MCQLLLLLHLFLISISYAHTETTSLVSVMFYLNPKSNGKAFLTGIFEFLLKARKSFTPWYDIKPLSFIAL